MAVIMMLNIENLYSLCNLCIVEVTDLRLEFYDYESLHGLDHTNKVITHILENYKPQLALEEKDWSVLENIEQECLDPLTYNTPWYK